MKVIVDGSVWIPLDSLSQAQAGRLRTALTIQPINNSEYALKDPDPILLYEENDTHIGVPRAFYTKNATKEPDFDNRITIGPLVGPGFTPAAFTGSTSGQFAEQNDAHDAILALFNQDKAWVGGILQAGCAFGKTAVGLRVAASLGRRTLVIVNRGFFMRQWTDRIKTFFPAAKIGYVQQNKCDFRGKDIVIAMVHSLASRRYEDELYSTFGLVITDEVHRISSQTWHPTITMFSAKYRLGLSATPRRKDGTERVFFEHIGPVIYAAKSESMIPKIARRKTSFVAHPHKYASGKSIPVRDLKTSALLSQASEDPARNKDLVDVILQAIKKGRKVFVVSERLEQLWEMSQMLRQSVEALGLKTTWAFATGDQYQTFPDGRRIPHDKKKGEFKTRKTTDEDLDQGESAQVLFATKQMIEEGFDVCALDVLIVATPVGDIEQMAGRVRRWCFPEPKKCARLCPWRAGACTEKPQPIIVDPVDDNVEKLAKKWIWRKKFYQSIGAME